MYRLRTFLNQYKAMILKTDEIYSVNLDAAIEDEIQKKTVVIENSNI